MPRSGCEARRGEGPTLIDAKISRMKPHTSEDNQLKYRTKEELEEAAQLDPIAGFTAWLIERGWITAEDAMRVQFAFDREAQMRRTGPKSSRTRDLRTR